MKKYRNRIRVTWELFDWARAGIDDEHFYRQMVNKIIQDIPLEELKRLFNFEKTDTRQPVERKMMYDLDVPIYIRERLRRLDEMQVVEYEGSIEI